MPQPALSITHKNSVAFITAVMNSTSRICLMPLWKTAPPADSLVLEHLVQGLVSEKRRWDSTARLMMLGFSYRGPTKEMQK